MNGVNHWELSGYFMFRQVYVQRNFTSAHRVHFCDIYGYQNKQRLFGIS